MAACSSTWETMLIDLAAGELDDARSAELDRHLVDCAPCRAEAEETRAVLELARLPEPSAHELSALGKSATSTRSALRLAEKRDRWLRHASVGALGAAAAMLLVLSPSLFKRHPANTLTLHTPPTLAPVAESEDDEDAPTMNDGLAEDASSDDSADAQIDLDPDVDLPLSDVF